MSGAMDHAHYRYSPMPTRPVAAWPGGASLAVMVLLHLEHWEIDPPENELSDPRFKGGFGSYHPDYRTWSQREYGARVGMDRFLRLLADIDVRATVAVSALAARPYAPLLADIVAAGHEVVAHGLSARRMISSRLEEAAERSHIAQALDILEGAVGARPRGWLSQDFGQSARTPQLLAEAGVKYLLDWPNDDQPYPLTTIPPMLSIPAQPEWDDATLWGRKVSPWRYGELVGDAAAVLASEGGGRLLSLGLRPWISGQPFRFRHVAEALRFLRYGKACWLTAGQIAEAWAAPPPLTGSPM